MADKVLSSNLDFYTQWRGKTGMYEPEAFDLKPSSTAVNHC